MLIREFKENDILKRLWWLHDSFWHAALVRELGPDKANQLNFEASEKIFRMLTNTLLREKIIQRPSSIQDLMLVFRAVWKNAFFDDLYVNEPIEYEGDTAVWTGTRCHAYDSLKKADMLDGYECGCQTLKILRQMIPFSQPGGSLAGESGQRITPSFLSSWISWSVYPIRCKIISVCSPMAGAWHWVPALISLKCAG